LYKKHITKKSQYLVNVGRQA